MGTVDGHMADDDERDGRARERRGRRRGGRRPARGRRASGRPWSKRSRPLDGTTSRTTFAVVVESTQQLAAARTQQASKHTARAFLFLAGSRIWSKQAGMDSALYEVRARLLGESLTSPLDPHDVLLSNSTDHAAAHGEEHGGAHGIHEPLGYMDMLRLLTFLLAIWGGGQGVSKFMPAIVGELIIGSLLGPQASVGS